MTEPYYSDGFVTLYHADCREVAEWLAGEVMVTDPPYGISWSGHGGGTGYQTARRHPGIANDSDTAMRDWALERFDGPAVVFGSLYAPFPADLRQVLIWEKPPGAGVVGSTTGFRRDVDAVFLTGQWPAMTYHSGSVLRSSVRNAGGPASPAGQTGHPHSKPVDLMRQLIEAAPMGLVVDPFAGSGATLLAAKDLGRSAIGVESFEPYCEIAAKRLAQEVLAFT